MSLRQHVPSTSSDGWAIQAQDYVGGLWGIGLRTKDSTRADVERAIAAREIVRSWPMRATLHFVAAEDVRWILRALAPRVVARIAGRHRQLALDARTFAKAEKSLSKALDGGKALTRAEVYAELARGGIDPTGQRGIHVLAYLAMRGVLYFGARRGKQPTFVLLDEWVPRALSLDGDEALGELARRYFSSHGPATLADFAWWTGLSLGEARRAVDVAGTALEKSPYFMGCGASTERRRVFSAHLLPPYDEYAVAYRDRSAILDEAHAAATRNGIFSPVVLVDGHIAGTWRRETTRDDVRVVIDMLVRGDATHPSHARRGKRALSRIRARRPHRESVVSTRPRCRRRSACASVSTNTRRGSFATRKSPEFSPGTGSPTTSLLRNQSK